MPGSTREVEQTNDAGSLAEWIAKIIDESDAFPIRIGFGLIVEDASVVGRELIIETNRGTFVARLEGHG